MFSAPMNLPGAIAKEEHCASIYFAELFLLILPRSLLVLLLDTTHCDCAYNNNEYKHEVIPRHKPILFLPVCFYSFPSAD